MSISLQPSGARLDIGEFSRAKQIPLGATLTTPEGGPTTIVYGTGAPLSTFDVKLQYPGKDSVLVAIEAETAEDALRRVARSIENNHPLIVLDQVILLGKNWTAIQTTQCASVP